MKRDSFGRPQDATATQPISHDVLKEKYLKAGESGFEDVYRRVARALASVEAEADRAKYEALFLDNLHAGAIGAGRIAPGGSVEVDADLVDAKGHGLPGTIAAVVAPMYPHTQPAPVSTPQMMLNTSSERSPKGPPCLCSPASCACAPGPCAWPSWPPCPPRRREAAANPPARKRWRSGPTTRRGKAGVAGSWRSPVPKRPGGQAGNLGMLAESRPSIQCRIRLFSRLRASTRTVEVLFVSRCCR